MFKAGNFKFQMKYIAEYPLDDKNIVGLTVMISSKGILNPFKVFSKSLYTLVYYYIIDHLHCTLNGAQPSILCHYTGKLTMTFSLLKKTMSIR